MRNTKGIMNNETHIHHSQVNGEIIGVTVIKK